MVGEGANTNNSNHPEPDDMPEEHPYPRFIERRESSTDAEAWHLSKSVPLAFVLTLLIQTVVLVSWAATFKSEFNSFRAEASRQFIEMRSYIDAKTDGRITESQVRAEFLARDQRLASIEKKDDDIMGEIRRVQTQINNKLERIETKLDKHSDTALHRNGNGG